MSNSGTKKSLVGPIEKNYQNPPHVALPTVARVNPFGSLVGLLVLEMFCRLHFLDKIAKTGAYTPKNSFFSFLWLICQSYLGQFHSVLDDFKQPAYL